MNRNIQSSNINSSNSIENENEFFDVYEDEIVKNCEENSFRKLYYSYYLIKYN